MSQVILAVTLAIPNVVFLESFLGFLGFLGFAVKPPLMSWGLMLQDTANYSVIGSYPWIPFPPWPSCSSPSLHSMRWAMVCCATQSTRTEKTTDGAHELNTLAPEQRHNHAAAVGAPIIDARHAAGHGGRAQTLDGERT